MRNIHHDDPLDGLPDDFPPELKDIIKNIQAKSGHKDVEIKVIKLSPSGGEFDGEDEECDCPACQLAKHGGVTKEVKDSLAKAINVEELWTIHKNEHYPDGLPEGTNENTLKYAFMSGMKDTITSMQSMNMLSQMGIPNELLNEFVNVFESSVRDNCDTLFELLFKGLSKGTTLHSPNSKPENN